jgi:hypothetical protein
VSSKLSLFDLQLSLVKFFELGLSILSKSSNSSSKEEDNFVSLETVKLAPVRLTSFV